MFETCEKHLSQGQVLPYGCANNVTQSRWAAPARRCYEPPLTLQPAQRHAPPHPPGATPHPTCNHV